MLTEIKLYLVVPCYNEEEILKSSAEKALNVFSEMMDSSVISRDSRILIVDDGSIDNSWNIIKELHNTDKIFSGIRLSRNTGHQVAIYSGMMYAYEHNADCVITIDADMQQDITALPEFLEKYSEGCDIVYGVRNSRDTDSVFKRSSASFYYKLMRILGCNLVDQSADYRLLSRRAVYALSQYKESNLFIRGIVTDMGFKSDVIHFDVTERAAGSSKYTLNKMISLALSGITSFSIKPIRIVTIWSGGVSLLISIIMMLLTLIDYFRGVTVPGWSTIVISIWFLGGMQLLSIGVIGEYLGRTYIESKKRPRYFIMEETDELE